MTFFFGMSNSWVFFLFSAAGISRSVTITVMYLMSVSSLSFDEALTVVQHCRQMANPNMGFRAQLVRYQEDKLLQVQQTFL